MTEKIIIAGSGGQGIMLLGKVLAQAALRENKFVSWFPSYGAEVRGGAAYCMVVISDEEIAFPYVQEADTLIIMNQPSLTKFEKRVCQGGLLMLNSSLIKIAQVNSGVKIFKGPFTDLAIELGNIKVANMIALGSFIASKKSVKVQTIIETIEEIAPSNKKELIEINKEALQTGIGLIK